MKPTTKFTALAAMAVAPAAPAWPDPPAGGKYARDPVTGALQPKAAAPAPQPASTENPEE